MDRSGSNVLKTDMGSEAGMHRNSYEEISVWHPKSLFLSGVVYTSRLLTSGILDIYVTMRSDIRPLGE